MKKVFFILVLSFSAVFYSCSPTKRFTDDKPSSNPQPRYNDFAKETISLETTIGTASYYGKEFDGKKTSSGEIYNMYDLTAAHKTYPFGTELRITNIQNKKSVTVRINDRMPLSNNRSIDLSYGAAKELDILKSGLAKVIIQVIKWGKEN
jgi:rare lipoprotein A (peptidoglycan hydrolase)